MELMQHLSAALASLSRFQQLAFTDSQPLPSARAPTQSRPSLLPSPATSSPFTSAIDSFYPTSYHEINPQTEPYPNLMDTPSTADTLTDVRQALGARPGLDEECCGGVIDCRELVEDRPEEDIGDISSNPMVKNSNIRSTLGRAPTL